LLQYKCPCLMLSMSAGKLGGFRMWLSGVDFGCGFRMWISDVDFA
jgi:hypothetical protein